MRRLKLVVSLSLVPLFLAGVGHAVPFENPQDAFHFEFEPPGAEVCSVIPRRATRTPDCEGVDLERVTAQNRGARQIVLVRRGSQQYVLTYHSGPKLEGAQWLAAMTGRVEDRHPGATVRRKNPAGPERFHVGDAEVWRVVWSVRWPNAGREPSTVVMYWVPGETESHTLRVEGPPDAAIAAERDLDAALQSLQVEISVFAKIWVHAGTIGLFIAGVLGLVLAVSGVVVWMGIRARRAALRPRP